MYDNPCEMLLSCVIGGDDAPESVEYAVVYGMPDNTLTIWDSSTSPRPADTSTNNLLNRMHALLLVLLGYGHQLYNEGNLL